MNKIITTLLLMALFIGCSTVHKRDAAVKKSPQIQKESGNEAGPIERLTIMEKGENEAMRVVQDDSEEGNRFLRVKTHPVDADNPVFHHLAKRMRVTLDVIPGVGIAAPQVGIDRRMAIVQRLDKENKPFVVYYNPFIVEYSKEKKVGWEGCLSIPAGFGKVNRSTWIVVEHDTAEKGVVREKIEGFTAVIFQHELDHLDGVLFVDRMDPKHRELMSKEEYYQMRKAEKEKAREENSIETEDKQAPIQ